MSSSAFTPTQTQITNNVPTNVPVVEAAELVSITFINGGTISSQEIFKRQVGGFLHLYGTITFSSAGSAALLRLRIPSGLTLDLTKVPDGSGVYGASIGISSWYDISVGSKDIKAWASDSTSIAFSVTGAAGNLQGNELASGDTISINLWLPIAEWAGSGTTTLATRAVEEYAYNSDVTSTASITASGFANGPSGVNLSSLWSTPNQTYVRRVRFQNAILPTDYLILEFDTVGNGSFAPGVYTYTAQGTTRYGALLTQVSGSSTDCDVTFSAGGRQGDAGSYAGQGSLWSSVAATTKWRVRKVSSGAQVGYPVSARNIIGDTSGTVVPTGMIGETLSSAITTSVNAAATSLGVNITSITLSAGTWLVTGSATLLINGATFNGDNDFGVNTTSATVDGASYGYKTMQIPGISSPSSRSSGTTVPIQFNLSTTTTVYLIGLCRYSAGTPQWRGAITATRIA
jgi:hypothetical protein